MVKLNVLYVLIGEDDFSLRQSVEAIKRGLGDPSGLATNTATLDGERLTVDQLRGACETMPFLAEKRLVIIERLLERFEPRPRTGQKKRTLESKKDDSIELAGYLSGVPDFTVVLVVGGKIGSRNPLLTALSGKATVKSFPLLRGDALRQWVEDRVAAAGAVISPGAAEHLVRFVGGDLWAMANEIDKLTLFAAGRPIEEKDVKAMVSYSQEANVFAMVDAILASRADVAGPLLQKLLQWGAAPAYLLVMLARQTQLVVRMKELAGQKKSRPEIQESLGLASDFALRKTMEQAQRYSMERLREVYHRLLEADISIKTGRYDGDLALDILVAELCEGRPNRQP